MKPLRFKIVALLATLALFLSIGCGSDDVGGNSDTEHGPALYGTVTLEEAEDFSGVEVSAGEHSVTTDEQGSYEIGSLSAGVLEVTASHPDYQSQTMEVEIIAGDSVELDFELFFPNQPPVIDSVVVDPVVLLPGEQAQVSVQAHDPDGDELSYSYEATNGFVVESGDEPGEAQLWAADEFGVSTELTVSVEDSEGASASETVAVETRGHDDPVIESISVIPEVFEPGATGDLEVVAHSPNDDALSYTWDAPEGWDIEPVDEATAALTAPDAIDEEALIEVVVEDEFGGQATESVIARTSEGNQPVITGLTVDPAQVAPGEESTLEVEAHDPDGTALSYEWSVSASWTVVDPQQAITDLIAPDEYGAQTEVDIVVTDEYGLSASAKLVVSTIANQGPQIQSLSADPVEVFRGGTIDLEAVATHPQDAQLTYDWSAPADWNLLEDPSFPATPQIESPDQPGVNATVELIVTDPNGKEAVASVLVRTSENQAPIIESLNATPAAAVPGETQTVQTVAYDPDGFPLDYQWDVPAGWQGTSTSDELVLTTPDDYGLSGTVTLTVDDGISITSATVTVSTVQAVDPSISSLTASPYVVDRQGSSTLEVMASHVYGEELNYAWSIDNSDWTLSESDETAELTAPDLSSSSVTATVEVTDNHGGSAESSVIVETSPNSAPVITSFDADPYVVDRAGTSTLSIDAYDPDGESLSYSWSADNGDWTLGESGDTAELTAPDAPDSSVTVTVEAHDGYGGSATSELMVSTASNQAPVIADLSVDPDDWVEPAGTALATAIAVDIDGDAISYDWSISGDWDIDATVGDDHQAQLMAPDLSNNSATVTVTATDEWGASATSTIDVRTQDIEPDPFGFDDQDDVAPNTLYTSNAVTVTGFEGPVSATCTDCEVSVNGGAFDTTVGDVYGGDTVEIRRESGGNLETVTAAVTIGATDSEIWTLTTAAWKGERIFSNCSQTGRLGPSQAQCDGEYDGLNLEGEVTVSSGIQMWTVPTTATYRIEVMGARGRSAETGRVGGDGARMAGDFDLTEGTELKILVGQEGTEADGNGGGGGGTFVTFSDDTPLIIAGGGGGTRHTVDQDGCHGRITEFAGTGSGSETTHDCGVKTTDLSEGGIVSSGSWGSAGGGLNSGGEADGTRGEGGESFIAGGQGGDAFSCSLAPGGFGSGGAGNGCSGGGGGGGYSGGDGGRLAGGGGSYNDGTNQDNTSGFNAGHGQVSIDIVD